MNAQRQRKHLPAGKSVLEMTRFDFAACTDVNSAHIAKCRMFLKYIHNKSTFISAAATFMLMTATDSLFRRRGSLLRAERELENEQSDMVPGVRGVCGTPTPSTSSTMRKARPRARGSTICADTRTHTMVIVFHQHSSKCHIELGKKVKTRRCCKVTDWSKNMILGLQIQL